MSTLAEIQRSVQTSDRLSVRPIVIAVSKLQPIEKIRQLYNEGQRHFGENYVQEALEKLQQLNDLDIIWHFIGSLQKNKVKFVVGNFVYIHSVDSEALAEVIDRKAREKELTQKIFIQVNLGGEDSKSGFSAEQLTQSLPQLKKLTHVQICGLMTMPPLANTPEESRPFFRQLRELQQEVQRQIPSCQYLSMGTSSDYITAAEEGAHYIRLGTVLFGERPKK